MSSAHNVRCQLLIPWAASCGSHGGLRTIALRGHVTKPSNMSPSYQLHPMLQKMMIMLPQTLLSKLNIG